MTVVPLIPTHQAVGVFHDERMTDHLHNLALTVGKSLTRAGYDLTGVTPNMIYQASTIQTRVLPEINGCRIIMRFPATGDPNTDRSTGPDPAGDVELIGGERDGEILTGAVTTLAHPTLHIVPTLAHNIDPVPGAYKLEYRRTGYDLLNQRWTYQLCKDTTP